MPTDAHIYEELFNICSNAPVFLGSTISHRTADACVKRGWAERDTHGDLIPTADGWRALQRWVDDAA